MSWAVRNRELDHMCPWFWSAAKLMHDYQRMLPGKEDGCYGTMTEVFKDKPKGMRFSDAATLIQCSQSHAECCWCVAVVMRRRAPINPLTEMIESKEIVCCMLPLMSGRRLVARVGSGPMKSAFHYSNHNSSTSRFCTCICQAWHCREDEGVCNPGAACLCYVPPVAYGR